MSVFNNNASLCNRRGQKPPVEYPDNNALTLTEKVCLLSLKNSRQTTWNDNLSLSLRGCILIDLCLRGRIQLEPKTVHRKTLQTRAVVVKDATPTGERLLDETLKYIKSVNPPITTPTWLEYLNGENWNPWTWKFQLKYVRERLSKDLVEKGYFKSEKVDYLLFESTRYSLVEEATRGELIGEILQTLLENWRGAASKSPVESLALVMMTSAAEIGDDFLVDLDCASSALAKTRLDGLFECDYEKEALDSPGKELLWAVFAAVLN